MKTIGILGGMTWESTVTYYQVINEYINKKLGDHHSAKILLYSVDFQEIEEAMRVEQWDRTEDVLVKAGLALREAGADFLVIATNTMHINAEAVQERIGLPLLHIAEVTADRLIADGIRKVGLLGTKYTMEKDFYKQVLRDRGLEVLIPEADARKQIFHVIDDELAFGEISETSRAFYMDEIEKLKERGAEGVILGYTEIGLLIQQRYSVLPVYDTA